MRVLPAVDSRYCTVTLEERGALHVHFSLSQVCLRLQPNLTYCKKALDSVVDSVVDIFFAIDKMSVPQSYPSDSRCYLVSQRSILYL